MNTCVFLLILLCFQTTANQLVAMAGGRYADGVPNKCFNEERHALLHFKNGLQDPDGILSTWRAKEADCCRWKGVMCNNQTGHVTGLQLHQGHLVGEISHSLLNLSHMNHLDIWGNSFHGTIPTFICSMTRLSYLDLSYNGFNGTIPRSIGSLTQLRHLDLGYNNLSGTIPLEFGNLTNLEWLSLGSSGKCRVENLQWLSHLSHLYGLDMTGVSLAKVNHWIDVILSLRKLLVLGLSGCELSEVMYPHSLFLNYSSSSIQTLNFSNNNLTSSMYHWLFPLTSNKLESLDLSGNMLDGIPKYFGNLSLSILFLANNSATVHFPDFLNNLSGCASSLEYLSVTHSHSNGTISDKLWKLPRLKSLDISFTDLRVPSTEHMSNLSQLYSISMRSCKLGPHFPTWIQSLKNLIFLDISNTGISDAIPLEFWNTWSSRLQNLNLSSNNISGKVPNLSSKFDDGSTIDLSSNNFHGPLPNVSSTLLSLNLSRNKFSGGISFLCQMVDGFLQFLDLSHNALSGQLPDCLWHLKGLKVLNLGHNSLSGRLPPSIGSLTQLKVLYLYKNNFSGELPFSLKNCTSLKSLNLGANKFSGNVPVWIGENLSELYVFILRSNNFFDTIPSKLCQLPNLQILDLSRNRLHGTIPSCLSNLTSIVHRGFSQEQDIDILNQTYGVDKRWYPRTYTDHAMIQWQGDEREFIRHLGLLKIIDLSSNSLTGQIPYEITNLSDLIVLNLSKNALFGEIPWQIGDMKNLETLDLSENNLSGRIPSSMSQMTFLSYLDVSSNHLSGRIPTSTQLQSFEPSKYDGNTGLCGPPLAKKCPGHEKSEVPSVVGGSEGDGEGEDELERWFYIGGATGFVTGFWIACGTLLFNRRFTDWVYVMVTIKLQRLAHTQGQIHPSGVEGGGPQRLVM